MGKEDKPRYYVVGNKVTGFKARFINDDGVEEQRTIRTKDKRDAELEAYALAKECYEIRTGQRPQRSKEPDNVIPL
ncbi:MAG: hypothetical protein KAS32_04110, partial [Candidatus Peribacteraceae bacterium]|nr:hypothetical protein [Candidatus Peribacteraceae bacterium]